MHLCKRHSPTLQGTDLDVNIWICCTKNIADNAKSFFLLAFFWMSRLLSAQCTSFNWRQKEDLHLSCLMAWRLELSSGKLDLSVQVPPG